MYCMSLMSPALQAGARLEIKSPALKASWEPVPQPEFLSWDFGEVPETADGGYMVPPEMTSKLILWLRSITSVRAG